MRGLAMLRAVAAAMSVSAVAASFVDGSSAQDRRREILGPDGRVIEVLGSEGRPRDLATAPTTGRSTAGSGFAVRQVGSWQACPSPDETRGSVRRESRGRGFTVDSCGRTRSDEAGGRLPYRVRDGVFSSAVAAPVTIDRMTTRVTFGSYAPGGTLTLLGSADVYHLSDATSWTSGAGSYVAHWSQLVGVEVDGATIRYVLSPPEVGLLYEQTDYDSGDHSSQGKLGAAGPLVIEAQAGSTTAVLHGEALVVSNDATWYGEPRFNYFSAIVGSVVPFELTYTISGDTWQADTFTRPFTYTSAGSVDFVHPVSTPRAVELSISGPSRVPDEFTVSFRATVRYENDVTRDGTATATWTVEPASLASVSGGVLTTGKLSTAGSS
jgi:hypothetical protein